MKDITVRVLLPNGKSVIVNGKQFDMSKQSDRLAHFKYEIELSNRRKKKQ